MRYFLTLLLLFAAPAWAQNYTTRSVSVTTTATLVVPATANRLSYTVKNGTSSSAAVYCGGTANDANFELSAGEGYTFEKMTRQEIWCRAASGTQTVYVMELR